MSGGNNGVQVFPHLLPYHSFKEAKRHSNLRRGDICLLLYEGKICGTYKMCRILETIVSDDNLIRTVKVGFPKQGGRVKIHPKSKRVVDAGEKDDYPLLDTLVVGIPRLVLILPVEDSTVDCNKMVHIEGTDWNQLDSVSNSLPDFKTVLLLPLASWKMVFLSFLVHTTI